MSTAYARRQRHRAIRAADFAAWRESWLAKRPGLGNLDAVAEQAIGRDAWHRAVYRAHIRNERDRRRSANRIASDLRRSR